MEPGCQSGIDVLKKGPANIPKIISEGNVYTDPNFGGDANSLFWDGYSSDYGGFESKLANN